MTRRAGIALILLFLIVGFLSTPTFAQDAYRIVEIEVDGNRVTTSSLILSVGSIGKGSTLTPSLIQDAMHRLWGLGIFSDVNIEVEEVAGGLKVYILVSELPKLGALKFTGNKKIKSSNIRDKLGLGVGGYISPYLMTRKAQVIREMYAEKGYFQAVVTPELTYSVDSTNASLTYNIDEKSKVKVEKVFLTGNVRVEADRLIRKMRNRKRGFLKSSDFAQEKYEEDLKKVIGEYHKRGFIDAYMVSDSFTIDTVTNLMSIYLEVYEGPLYYFGNVTFKGNDVLPEKFLGRLMKFTDENIFNEEKYEESLVEIYTSYQEIGHLHVRVDDQRSTRSDSIINITYDITEGLPSHVNLVKIVGNTKTKDHVIRREISMFPGQVFNRSLLVRSLRDIMALNYFANVLPDPVNLPNGDVDVEFQIEEKQTGQISAGAGYNSQDKIVGSLGMGIPNFRGMGQNLSFNIDFGTRRNSFTTSFTEPWLFGRPTLLGSDLFVTNRRFFNDYTEGRQGGSIRLGRRLRWPDNYFRIFTSFRLERNRFFDFDSLFVGSNSFSSSTQWNWQELDTNSVLVDMTSTRINNGDPIPGSPLSYQEKWNSAVRWSVSITRDSRNLPEFATKGSMVSYTFENTGGLLGGFWNYRRHRLSIAKFVPLFWNFALAARLEYGGIISTKDDPNDLRVLLTDRFIPGGTTFDGIVRGYDDGSLTPDTTVTFSDTTFIFNHAPDDADTTTGFDSLLVTTISRDARIRGNHMLIGNFEVQFPIVERSIYGLLFFDAGNSWLQLRDIKLFSDLYKGYGVGFRVLVPGIGTIGFDFAYPLDKIDRQEQKWRPHFQLGTTFR